jgi:hypothetical protein
VRRGSWGEFDVDIELVPGDEPTRSRDDNRDRRIACGRCRKQNAQRVALVELGKTGDAVALAEADFGGALGQ